MPAERQDAPLRIFYDTDCDQDLLRSKSIAVIGYGSQARAQALNLKDSGMNVVIALREGSSSAAKAIADGFEASGIAEAAAYVDLAIMLIPDEEQAEVYVKMLGPHMKKGAALVFAHGLNIHFGLIKPRADLDVFMVAPKGQAQGVRNEYTQGRGVPCFIAVSQDVSGTARDLALAYAGAIGGGRAGIIETSFGDECETDLFGEQAVLCGGISALVLAGYETLVDAGYPPEVAYFECVHETKLVVDLIYERGLADMRKAISNTAEYGDYTRGPRLIDNRAREEMKKILQEIQSGAFAREFLGGNREGLARLPEFREKAAQHTIEKTGRLLRSIIFKK